MELYLQFGWGMKKLVLDFSKTWSNVNVILSPRDITPKQLEQWDKDFSRNGIRTAFDPQCFYPKCDHPRLSLYEYWNRSFSTNISNNNGFEYSLIEKIEQYNDIANTDKFIIPATMRPFDEEWHNKFKSESRKLVDVAKQIVSKRELYLTLALPAELLCQREAEIEKILEITEKLNCDGYYIIAQPYNDNYLVDTPSWLSNLMQLCAGLKLQNSKLIVGYSNQQMLCLAAAKVDVIATGTYLNVRKFSNKFEPLDSIKRRSVWYYYPESLSEYKISYLDFAFNAGVLAELEPDNELGNEYIDYIFSGNMPSSTRFNEPLAFRHYLESINKQVNLVTRDSYKETMAAIEMLLTTAERRIEYLEKMGVYAQARSFKDIVDVNRSALSRLNATRGFMLENLWNSI